MEKRIRSMYGEGQGGDGKARGREIEAEEGALRLVMKLMICSNLR